MIQVDMSEYMEKRSVSRLVGSPPGYVGYGEGRPAHGGRAAQAVSVLLLDEIGIRTRLRHPAPDPGGGEADRLAGGRKVATSRSSIVIMTSNIGAGQIASRRSASRSPTSRGSRTTRDDRVTERLKKVFRPELLNRIDL